MTKPPTFQLYVKDFLEGTAAMSNAEAGAYIKLLCHQWLKDGLPNDMAILIRFCGGDPSGIDGVLNKFKGSKNGTLKNTRLETERKKQKKFAKIRKKTGEKGAKTRWHNEHKANGLDSRPNFLPNGLPSIENGSSSSIPSSSSNNTNTISHTLLEVIEIMRRQLNRSYSDELVERVSKKILHDYHGEKIYNISALVGKYIKGLKPDCKAKLYNPGTGQYVFMEIEKWEKTKGDTELIFECYELG